MDIVGAEKQKANFVFVFHPENFQAKQRKQLIDFSMNIFKSVSQAKISKIDKFIV